MIIESRRDVLSDIAPWTVLLQQVNCQGSADGRFAKRVREMFPGWYSEYARQCEQEKHKERLLGTIHAYQPRHDLIICSAFAQLDVTKARTVTNFDAWDDILARLESEISAKNAKDDMNWSISIQHGLGCDGGGDWQTMRNLLERRFGDSPVMLTICGAAHG